MFICVYYRNINIIVIYCKLDELQIAKNIYEYIKLLNYNIIFIVYICVYYRNINIIVIYCKLDELQIAENNYENIIIL